jgi:6-phosphogluconolactonase
LSRGRTTRAAIYTALPHRFPFSFRKAQDRTFGVLFVDGHFAVVRAGDLTPGVEVVGVLPGQTAPVLSTPQGSWERIPHRTRRRPRPVAYRSPPCHNVRVSAKDPQPIPLDPYPLGPARVGRVLPRPPLPGSVVVRETPDDVIDAAASDLLFQAFACVREFGDFHLALSGGSTPEPLYRRLMYDPGLRSLPWSRTHLWVVDERRVPLDDERSNFKMIRETIVEHADIPAEQVHPIEAILPDADTRYEHALRACLEWREKGHDRLDCVVLGMGADGHTASLFPRSPALVAPPPGRLVLINDGPTVTPPDRVTMTLALLNASRFIAVLVMGEKKRHAVARVIEGLEPVAELPIRGVCPLAGELRWYLDEAACPAKSAGVAP